MAFTPEGKLYLLNVDLQLSNKNQLDFENTTEQYNYFYKMRDPEFSITDYTYMRKDSSIAVPFNIDKLWNINYVMYQNSNFSSKWFYAFIIGKEYLSDNVTRIYLKTDVFQTWQFDFYISSSFIERAMIDVNLDLPGYNLVPENLEFGELNCESTTIFSSLKPMFVIAYNRNPKEDGLTSENMPSNMQGIIVNGIPNGVYYWVCSKKSLQTNLATINAKGHGNAIMTIFSVPAFSVVGLNGFTIDKVNEIFSAWIVDDFLAPGNKFSLSTRPNSLDGYTPRNKKLLTYPYLYLGFNPSNRK